MIYILVVSTYILSFYFGYLIGIKKGIKKHKFSYSTRISGDIKFSVAPGEKILLTESTLLDHGCAIYGVHNNEGHSMTEVSGYGNIVCGFHIYGVPDSSPTTGVYIK